MNDNSTSESLSLNSGPLIDNIQQESSIADVESEVSALPQPFIPEPEAPIDPTECRMRLLEHIEHFQCHLDSRLTSIEAQICGKSKKKILEKEKYTYRKMFNLTFIV